MRTGRRARAAQPGFTLLELMVVIAIILILLGMASVRYQRTILASHEAELKTDLQAMRDAIDQYTLDNLASPQTLQDLLHNYLKEIPVDPITQRSDWQTVPDDGVLLSPDQQSATGIMDVHSASGAISPIKNTAYNTW